MSRLRTPPTQEDVTETMDQKIAAAKEPTDGRRYRSRPG